MLYSVFQVDTSYNKKNGLKYINKNILFQSKMAPVHA